MATNFPDYPASTFEQAVDLTIFAGNQLHEVVNGDALTEIETENGAIPSVRKSLVDNMYFKDPIDWKQGGQETVFNQLRLYIDPNNNENTSWYFAPSATETNPITMGESPIGDFNWKIFGDGINDVTLKYVERAESAAEDAEEARDEARDYAQSAVTLSKIYPSEQDAQHDIDNGLIPEGVYIFVRSSQQDFVAMEYQNVSGKATPTGKAIISQKYIDELITRIEPLQKSPDSLFDVVSANGIRPFRIRSNDGGIELEMILKLLTGDSGLNFGGSILDNNAPEGWKFLIYSANGLIVAGVKDDGTKVGWGGSGGGGEPGQSGVIIPGDTVTSYDEIRNYTGESTVMEVIGNRIHGKFVVNDSDTTSEDDGGGILVGTDGRRWYRQADFVSYDMFSAPRIPEETYQQYVSLSKSGQESQAQALLENQEPADQAMINCHKYAALFNIPVVQNTGRFLWVSEIIPVRTSCHLKGSTIVTCNRSGTSEARWGTVDGVDDGSPDPMWIYHIEGKERIDLTSSELNDLNVNYSKYLKKGSATLPFPKLYEYRGGYFGYISSAVELYRGGNRSNPRTQVKYRDFARIGRNGALSDQLVKNIPDGTVIEAWIQPKEDSWLDFDSPLFFEAGNGRKFVNIQCARSMVNINDVVLSTWATGNVESRVAVGSYGVTDIRLNNGTMECMPNEVGGAYAIAFRNSIEIHVNAYYGLYGWGFQGHHGLKRIYIDKSVMNRFDFHSFGYDVNITRTHFQGKQIYLQGGGKYTFEDIDFLVTPYSVSQDSGTLQYRQGYMINMREDYAGDCDCNLTVRDCVIRFDRNITSAWASGVLSFDVVEMNSGTVANYGLATKTPHTIVGENIVFDLESSSPSLPDNFAFTFCRPYRARYSTSQYTYLPDLVSVRDMTAINVPQDKNAFMAVFRIGADLSRSPISSRTKLRPDGTNARIFGENIISVVNNPVVALNACPMIYLPGDTSAWDTNIDGTTYRTSDTKWVPKVTLVNCDPIIIYATGAMATFDIHGGLLARFTSGDTGNRIRITGSDIQLYPDANGQTYFDISQLRAVNCDWLDPANGATYTGTLPGFANENRGTPEHSPNV